MKALTPKQQRFVDEYLIDLNATQAAIRAGYSKRTAGSQAFDLLKKPEIQHAISTAQKEREHRTQITQDRVLQEIARIAFFDIRTLYRENGGGMKDPDELDADAAAALVSVEVFEEFGGSEEQDAQLHGGSLKRKRGQLIGFTKKARIAGFTKKARIADKVAALTLAARHLGMLKEKVEHTGAGGGPILTGAVSQEQLAEAVRSVRSSF